MKAHGSEPDRKPIEDRPTARPWVTWLWTVAVLLMMLWGARESLLRAYGSLLVVDDATPGADALMVLGGDPIVRVPHALDLLERGYAPRLLVSDPKPRMHDFQQFDLTEGGFAALVQQSLGLDYPIAMVPSVDGATTSTLDEARDLRVYAEAEGLRHVIATTGACSTRRARIALRQAFEDSDIRVEVSPAENEIFDATNWWRSDKGIQCYILEPVKMAAYLARYADPDWMKND